MNSFDHTSSPPSFDYIVSKDLRDSLEKDYKDMRGCLSVHAWKAAQVLSGSIVEALLVDYLTSTPGATPSGKDPLKLDLNECIDLCKTQKVISSRTADLCSVIRSYRNLIHPGRQVRLNEQAANEGSCTIAVALVELIVIEIAKIRRSQFGLTAEQVVAKLLCDSGCLTILPHLLAEVSTRQLEELLLVGIPEAYATYAGEDEDDPTWERLIAGFRIAFAAAHEDIKRSVSEKFVGLLKSASDVDIAAYRYAFFCAGDMMYLKPDMKSLVKDHLLGAVGQIYSQEKLRLTDGIGPFLTEDDCVSWIDPIVRTLISSVKEAALKEKLRSSVFMETLTTTKEFDRQLAARLEQWLPEKGEATDKFEILRAVRDDLVITPTPP